jgi:signal transduction histidine kinase
MKRYIFILLAVSLFSCSKKENSNLKASFPYDEYNKLLGKQKKKFLDSLYKDVATVPNNEQGVKYLFDLSTEYYYINDFAKSLKISRDLLEIAIDKSDTLNIAKSYSFIGDTYAQDHKDSAYFYYQKAEKLYQIIGNDEHMGKMSFNKAYVLFYEGNYLQSEIELSKALQLLKSNSNHELLYTVYNLMGCNLENLEDYEAALDYFEQAKNQLKMAHEAGINYNSYSNCDVAISINMANIYDKTHQYEKSITTIKPLITKELEDKWPNDYSIALGNLGYSMMKKGDLQGVEPMLYKSLNASIKHGNQTTTFYKLITLGEYYLTVKDTAKSLQFLKKALFLGKRIKANSEIKLIYELLAKAEPHQESYYKEKIIHLSDSLAVVQRKTNNKYARIAYETSEIEDRNKVLSKNNLYLLIGSVISVVLFTVILVLRYWRNKKKEFEYERQLQEANVELFDLMQHYQVDLNQTKAIEQNRISKELHDSVMNKLLGVHLVLKTLNESDESDIKAKRKKYIEEIHTIENEIREITHDLRTEEIEAHFNFKELLLNCIQQANEMGATRFNLDCDPMIDWESVSGLIKITIYRIIQEAISNASKYAEASECKVVISLEDNQTIDLSIHDNGKGFDRNGIKSQGIGLKNMKERAEKVNAHLSITTQLGAGTKIQCSFKIGE